MVQKIWSVHLWNPPLPSWTSPVRCFSHKKMNKESGLTILVASELCCAFYFCESSLVPPHEYPADLRIFWFLHGSILCEHACRWSKKCYCFIAFPLAKLGEAGGQQDKSWICTVHRGRPMRRACELFSNVKRSHKQPCRWILYEHQLHFTSGKCL